MYHRVIDPVEGVSTPTWNVTPSRLEAQLCYLLQRGYEAWRLNDLVDYWRSGLPIPRRAFAVTFDDGYRCVLTQALPILRRLQVPATIFVATGLLGARGRMIQDDWVGAGDDRVPLDYYEAMSLRDCDQIVDDPLFDIGSHTHTHQDFRGNECAFQKDIEQSMAFIRVRWGLDDVPFAFPYGATRRGFCSPKMRDMVKRAGFSCALTADNRIVDPHQDDCFAWARIVSHDSDSGRVLAAKLDNWYGAFKRLSLGQFASVSAD